MTASIANQTAIIGIGATAFTRSSGVAVDRLAADAASAAMDDARLDPADIDGVIAYASGARAEDLIVPLGLPNVGYSATVQLGGASGVSALQVAAGAIVSGLARHVLVFIARNGSTESRIGARISSILPSPQLRTAFEHPVGLFSPAQHYSMICRRHMHEYGTRREDLAEVALTMRAHAQLNPKAQMFGRELTMEKYLSSRPIAEPYLLADCCLETDGAVAVILSAAAEAPAGRPRVLVSGAAEGRPPSGDDLSNRDPFFDIGLTYAAPRAFEMAGLRPEDLDIAMIYDCFTFEVIHQLEELGVCPRGEGGPFVRSGAIRLGGRLPVNPHGGLMSEGHLGGMGHIAEAVRQLRGDAGERQVDGTEAVAVTGWGDFGDGSVAILMRG
ncbi:lipid-transfer protein [Brevibacterium daeguense]|uniref:Lipid-transfer protein n=1 Tax=Brevibacterium daeguense TaxID=909936 RepID=A0ABP8EFF7_9MICO|nr:thiolase family protein [Brevibacterium daeguense]